MMTRLVGVLVTGALIIFVGLLDANANTTVVKPAITGPGRCVDSADEDFKMYRDGYAAMVSISDTSAARNRANLGLPLLPANQVLMVADSAICQAASIAYDNELEISEPLLPVMVLQLGTKKVVVKESSSEEGPNMNILFNADFTQVIKRIWF